MMIGMSKAQLQLLCSEVILAEPKCAGTKKEWLTQRAGSCPASPGACFGSVPRQKEGASPPPSSLGPVDGEGGHQETFSVHSS